MNKVVIYSTRVCPYCTRAKQLLDSKHVAYQEILIDVEPDKRAEMERLCNRRSVPQIFINNQHIGGCDDLYALHHSNQLDALLNLKQGE